MSAPPCTTDGCDGFCHDQAYICPRCTGKLERMLGDLPALLAELEITATRQAVIGSGDGGRKSAEKPLPFHWNAADDLYAARNTLTSWVRILEDEGAVLLGEVPAGPICKRCTHKTCWQIRTHAMLDETALSLWLIRQVGWYRKRREATELYDEIRHLYRAVTRAIDRSTPLIFAGSCSTCKTLEPDGTVLKVNLYARLGANTVRCRKCGAEYDTAARRDQMLADAQTMLFNAATIALAVASFGYEMKVERIWKWKQRGLITPRGVDINGYPTYRLGDVLDKLHADEVRRRERAGAA